MADNIQMPDAGGVARTMRTTEGADGAHRIHHKVQGGQTVVHASKLVPTGPAEAVIGASTPVTGPVSLIGAESNTDVIYIGGSGVTSNTGFPVHPSGQGPPLVLWVENLDLIYCISNSASQSLRIIGGGMTV